MDNIEFEFTRMVKEHRTWIWRVSLNTCNNQVRRKKRDVETVSPHYRHRPLQR